MTKALYTEAVQRIERLHRRLLDLIGDEFERMGWDDINPTQALMLFSMRGGEQLTPGQIKARLVLSNATYNTTKLRVGKYLVQERARGDRRSLRLQLTPKGEEVAEVIEELLERHLALPGMDTDSLGNLNVQMARLERFWAEVGSYIGVAA